MATYANSFCNGTQIWTEHVCYIISLSCVCDFLFRYAANAHALCLICAEPQLHMCPLQRAACCKSSRPFPSALRTPSSAVTTSHSTIFWNASSLTPCSAARAGGLLRQWCEPFSSASGARHPSRTSCATVCSADFQAPQQPCCTQAVQDALRQCPWHACMLERGAPASSAGAGLGSSRCPPPAGSAPAAAGPPAGAT